MRTTVRRTRIVLVAAALLAAGIASGCGSSSYARREKSDRQLSARVDQSLAANPALSTCGLEATSHAGVVALLGEVPEETLRVHAETVATAVPGVVRVNNLILVAKSASKSEGSSPGQGALFISRAD